MLRRLANIFKVADLRNKIVFTLAIIALYQFGANIPVPGVSWAQVEKLQGLSNSTSVVSFLNLFSGGALSRMAIFGLGVMPYLTAFSTSVWSSIGGIGSFRASGAMSMRSRRRSSWRTCSRAR